MNTPDIAARNAQMPFSTADITEFKRVYGADIAEGKSVLNIVKSRSTRSARSPNKPKPIISPGPPALPT